MGYFFEVRRGEGSSVIKFVRPVVNAARLFYAVF